MSYHRYGIHMWREPIDVTRPGDTDEWFELGPRQAGLMVWLPVWPIRFWLWLMGRL